jgi:hypothetical protein
VVSLPVVTDTAALAVVVIGSAAEPMVARVFKLLFSTL